MKDLFPGLEPALSGIDAGLKQHLIAGVWAGAASGKTASTPNPATGGHLAHHANGSAEDVDRAVAAARSAFPKWRDLNPYTREKLRFAIADRLEATRDEIEGAVAGFVSAAVRARDARFDGVEIHGANSYLLDQFLTEAVNERTDDYDGSVAGRLHTTLEVSRAVHAAVGPDFVVDVRSSQGKVNDFSHKWCGIEEAAETYTLLGAAPINYIHTTEYEAWKPAFGEGHSLAWLIKRHSGLPVFANGSLHDPDRASELLSGGDADTVTLGRGALTHADWPSRMAHGKGLAEFDRGILSPLADLANADRIQAQVSKSRS